jgi:hypothetical protein
MASIIFHIFDHWSFAAAISSALVVALAISFSLRFLKCNVLLLHGNLADRIPIRCGFFLVRQERMVYRESEDSLDSLKREPERLASAGLKVFP